MKKKKTAASAQKPAPVKPAKDFPAVFARLQKILKPYEKQLSVVPYKPEFYCLQTRLHCHKGKPVWFAAIRMGKNYVSYHLLPVYMNPAMQQRIPPELKKRMQGKACFNFNAVDHGLFRELTELTRAGFQGYRAMKFVGAVVASRELRCTLIQDDFHLKVSDQLLSYSFCELQRLGQPVPEILSETATPFPSAPRTCGSVAFYEILGLQAALRSSDATLPHAAHTRLPPTPGS